MHVEFVLFKQLSDTEAAHGIAACCVGITGQHYGCSKHFWTHEMIDIVGWIGFFSAFDHYLAVQPHLLFARIVEHVGDHCFVTHQSKVQCYNSLYVVHGAEIKVTCFVRGPVAYLEHSTLTHNRNTCDTSFTLMWQVVTLQLATCCV